jgi:Ni2+-binding GTPase involved in maturation of urease and hydrogenase
MKIHLLSGFLGSGKTTAAANAARNLLNKGAKVGVITNDQGINLVDSAFFKSLDIPYRQVVDGCFCCNYNELDANIELLMNQYKPDTIFAESVGSCTDIVATVMKPLLKFRRDIEVTVSTFADIRLLLMILNAESQVFDEKVKYIYLKQLEEAGVIIISKIDLAEKEQVDEAKRLLSESYPGKIVLCQDSFNEHQLNHWLDTLDSLLVAEMLKSLNIDYDIYAEGEAKMAWFDQELEISGDAVSRTVDFLIKSIYEKTVAANYPIGHLKFMIDGKEKLSFTVCDNESEIKGVFIDQDRCNLLINARVQIKPDLLSAIVSDSVRQAEQEFNCTIKELSMASFQPGYPKPTHRLTASLIF